MIALGSDHGGYDLKMEVIRYLEEKNIEYKDYGCLDKSSCDYPEFGRAAAMAVANGECEKGIVICTTGIGISIDTALLQYDNWYMGIGIGPFMRGTMDYWVESRLVFEEKFFIGKNINEKWNFEIFTLHFSNGNFTNKNEGFNFFGVGFGYKF